MNILGKKRMKLFGASEVNTGRQIEFDIAKAVCILGMVIVHCYEELASTTLESGTAYYIMVIVLDALFGAATFMASMGLGIAYSWKGEADAFIKRGIKIFFLGYALNCIRAVIPRVLLIGHGYVFKRDFIAMLLNDDIMPFAGLALLLFGLLKKTKLSDKAIFGIALGMSILGSFIRFLSFDSAVVNQLVGLFFGTAREDEVNLCGYFPLFNWFIIVVIGYLYGKILRRCTNIKKYYAISFPVSAAIMATYMLIAIPNRLGMMNGDIFYYYHMTSLDVIICICGMIFATSLYHYISLIMSDKVKNVIKHISTNINETYMIHWVMIGWTIVLIKLGVFNALSDAGCFILAVIIYIAANVLSEMYARSKVKHKE